MNVDRCDRRRYLAATIVAFAVCGVAGCSSTTNAPSEGWAVERAQRLRWQPDDGRFGQNRALEASGMAFSGRYLIATSEKYARLLLMDPEDGLHTRVVELEVPRNSELEGIAWHGGALFMCDEAHATVFRAELDGGDESVVGLATVELPLRGIEVEGGKIGVEGIEVSADGTHIFLLLERSGDATMGCVSRLWRLRI